MATVIGQFNHTGSAYYVWREAGRPDNIHPFYYGLTKHRCDEAPNCAYGSVDAMLRVRNMHRIKVQPFTPEVCHENT